MVQDGLDDEQEANGLFITKYLQVTIRRVTCCLSPPDFVNDKQQAGDLLQMAATEVGEETGFS